MARTKNPSFDEEKDKENPSFEGGSSKKKDKAKIVEEQEEKQQQEKDTIDYEETESISRTFHHSTDSDEETVPLQPMKMYFGPDEYMKSFKLSAKCYMDKAVKTLEGHLKSHELDWFREHPQFNHFFHMHTDPNHRIMGMWMLLLRMTHNEKKKEVWFVVNGYSLREFALISGLDCHEYPNFYEGKGSLEFVGKQFGSGSLIRYQDVEEKLMAMKKPTKDCLKMAVLYFLCSVIVGKRKTGEKTELVDPFFLRAVDDLELCKTFSWGRFAFDHNLKEILHIMELFDGVVGASQIFPSFVMPLELLAFEAIPALMNNYREHVREANPECPRMCKIKFKKTSMKGIPMSELLDQLGTTKEIHSVMVPTLDEKVLMDRIMDEKVGWNDVDCVVVDGWMKRLTQEKKTIWFEELYNLDVAARANEENLGTEDANVSQEKGDRGKEARGKYARGKEIRGNVVQGNVAPIYVSKDDFLQLESRFKAMFDDKFKKLEEKIDEQGRRLTTVEANVRYLGGDWSGANTNDPADIREEGDKGSGKESEKEVVAEDKESEKEEVAEDVHSDKGQESEKEVVAEESEKEEVAEDVHSDKGKESEKEKEVAEDESEKDELAAAKESEKEKEVAADKESKKEEVADKESEKEEVDEDKETVMEEAGEEEKKITKNTYKRKRSRKEKEKEEVLAKAQHHGEEEPSQVGKRVKVIDPTKRGGVLV